MHYRKLSLVLAAVLLSLTIPITVLADGTDPVPPIPPVPHSLTVDGTDPVPPVPPLLMVNGMSPVQAVVS